MLGIILISHGEMCEGVRKSSEMIVGANEDLYSLSLTEEGVEAFRDNLTRLFTKLEKSYDQLIVVTDIPNATPYNETYRYILENKSKVILLSGMNLPMIIELLLMSENTTDYNKLVDQVLESGKFSIQRLEN